MIHCRVLPWRLARPTTEDFVAYRKQLKELDCVSTVAERKQAARRFQDYGVSLPIRFEDGRRLQLLVPTYAGVSARLGETGLDAIYRAYGLNPENEIFVSRLGDILLDHSKPMVEAVLAALISEGLADGLKGMQCLGLLNLNANYAANRAGLSDFMERHHLSWYWFEQRATASWIAQDYPEADVVSFKNIDRVRQGLFFGGGYDCGGTPKVSPSESSQSQFMVFALPLY